jgi:hypothetical protein
MDRQPGPDGLPRLSANGLHSKFSRCSHRLGIGRKESKLNTPERELTDRVKEWLITEGHPLEFQVAREFLNSGFEIRQGAHTKSAGDTPREVDVLAYKTDRENKIRIYQVAECKWSGDKPWIVFTSEAHQMADSACVAQTIASVLGRSIVWVLAGDPEVSGLSLFASPERAGFGGRQVFAKGNDLFYATIQSVIAKAKSMVSEYDTSGDLKDIPAWSAVAFPMIVVEGGLFEGFMDWESGEVIVRQISSAKVHWTGSDVWNLHASVDVVTRSYFKEFVSVRSREVDVMVEKMRLARTNIEACWVAESLAGLNSQKAPRGITGLPTVLRAILVKERDRKAKQPEIGAATTTEPPE